MMNEDFVFIVSSRKQKGLLVWKKQKKTIMPANMDDPYGIYQIKVTLLGTDPPIWRRLLVPSDMTLQQLHGTLQVAMGWEDCHLHDFRIGRQRFGKSDPMEGAFGGTRTASERIARLSDVLGRVRAKAIYTYDFGDSWDHEILVEKRMPAEPGRAHPACIAGECKGLPRTVAAYRASPFARSPQRSRA